MPSYLAADDALLLAQQMSDRDENMSESDRAKRHLRENEACDQVGRFFDLMRYADDWRPIVSGDADARPRQALLR